MELEPSFQAVFEAQEELCWLSEERQEEVMQQWMEMKWEERMSERDLVASLVNVKSARMAGETVVVEIGKWWYSVSDDFRGPRRSLEPTCRLRDYLQKLGLFGAKQSPEPPKILPTRPLKVEIIFGVWNDFRAPNRP